MPENHRPKLFEIPREPGVLILIIRRLKLLPGEVLDIGQIRPFQIRSPQFGHGQIGASKVGPCQVGAAQVGVLKLRAGQVESPKVGPVQVGPRQVVTAEILCLEEPVMIPGQSEFGQEVPVISSQGPAFGSPDLIFGQVQRLAKVGPLYIGPLQIGLVQIGPLKVGIPQIGPTKIDTLQSCLLKICFREKSIEKISPGEDGVAEVRLV